MKKKINLALQGGGSHGAFTWGVLDRLLEEDELEIDGISGTSAGAMNAVLVAYGLSIGGSSVARDKLSEFWHAVSNAGKFGLFKSNHLNKIFSTDKVEKSSPYQFFQSLTKNISSYNLNLPNLNPLETILDAVVDFDKLKKKNVCKLFISATHVKSGQLKIFNNDEIALNVIMASACLPFMFPAVEIDGELYWDGGYTANPTLLPLITNTNSSDILVVQIEPTAIKKVPTSTNDIMDRINTLFFNSNLMTELRAIDLINQLGISAKPVYLHSINADVVVQDLHTSSKLNTSEDFINALFKSGRESADNFLTINWDKLGQKSSAFYS
ncbi:MAG: patatin-like phospholipase family protein [Burkholderiales bacterium]|nr:patatin-like phospholipase family protein [Burkholderiales bacterium]